MSLVSQLLAKTLFFPGLRLLQHFLSCHLLLSMPSLTKKRADWIPMLERPVNEGHRTIKSCVECTRYQTRVEWIDVCGALYMPHPRVYFMACN
jgi:hypothetical protein